MPFSSRDPPRFFPNVLGGIDAGIGYLLQILRADLCEVAEDVVHELRGFFADEVRSLDHTVVSVFDSHSGRLRPDVRYRCGHRRSHAFLYVLEIVTS